MGMIEVMGQIVQQITIRHILQILAQQEDQITIGIGKPSTQDGHRLRIASGRTDSFENKMADGRRRHDKQAVEQGEKGNDGQEDQPEPSENVNLLVEHVDG